MAFLHNLWPEIVLLLEKANGNFIRRVLGPFFIEIDYWTEVLQFNGGNWKWQLNRENPFLDRCSNLSDCHSTCNFLLISIKKSQFLFIFFPPNGCNRIEFNACREEFSGNAEYFVRLLLCIPSEGPHTSRWRMSVYQWNCCQTQKKSARNLQRNNKYIVLNFFLFHPKLFIDSFFSNNFNIFPSIFISFFNNFLTKWIILKLSNSSVKI